jgi:hypothetical protein
MGFSWIENKTVSLAKVVIVVYWDVGIYHVCSIEQKQEGSQDASLAYSRLCLVVVRCFRIVFYLKFYQTGLHKSVVWTGQCKFEYSSACTVWEALT